MCGAFALLRVLSNRKSATATERRAARGGGTTALRTVTPKRGRQGRREELSGDYRERYVLGRALVARGEVERLTTALENAKDHGDKRASRSGKTAKPASVGSPNSTSNAAPTRAMRHVYEQEISTGTSTASDGRDV